MHVFVLRQQRILSRLTRAIAQTMASMPYVEQSSSRQESRQLINVESAVRVLVAYAKPPIRRSKPGRAVVVYSNAAVAEERYEMMNTQTVTLLACECETR